MEANFVLRGGILVLCWVGLCACASAPAQQGRIGNLEYALVEVRDRQDRQAEEFRERLESLEMSLLQQERFLQDFLTEARAGRSPWPADDSMDQQPRVGPAAASASEPEPKPEPELEPDPKSESEPKPAPKTTPQPVPSSPRTDDQAKVAYDQALDKYFSGNYAQARTDFFAFQERFPDHALIPNALYWQAESLYARKQFAQSIFVFKELSRRFPAHAKASDALLKAGYAYEQLGDIPNARFHLQIVIEDYPDTPAARLARKRLPELPAVSS